MFEDSKRCIAKQGGHHPRKEEQTDVSTLKELFTPNASVPSHFLRMVTLFWWGMFIAAWIGATYQFPFFANPLQVLQTLPDMWWSGIAHHIIISFRTNAEALLISAFIAFGLSYLSTVPFFRPPVQAAGTARFLGITGFVLIFILYFGGGHWLKVAIIVFGMAPYMIVSMSAAIAAIPREEWDHARTLRYGEWRCVWEVAIRGKRHVAAEVIRQCIAMGWMMLTIVEGLQRSEGGLGKVLIDYNKLWRFDKIFATQLLIFTIGFLLDVGLLWFNKWKFEYAFMKLERSK